MLAHSRQVPDPYIFRPHGTLYTRCKKRMCDIFRFVIHFAVFVYATKVRLLILPSFLCLSRLLLPTGSLFSAYFFTMDQSNLALVGTNIESVLTFTCSHGIVLARQRQVWDNQRHLSLFSIDFSVFKQIRCWNSNHLVYVIKQGDISYKKNR